MLRILPDGTRGDQPSTTSVLPSDQLSSQGIGHTKSSLVSNSQNKSGTRHPQSQSSLGNQTDRPPTIPLSRHRPSATTIAKNDIAHQQISIPYIRQRTISSPSPLRAEPSQPSAPPGSYFEPQSGASGFEPRSPLHKRPPASRSCHGIETLSGPPPALSTHRSYQGDSAWRYTQPVDLTGPGRQGQGISSIDALIRVEQPTTDEYINPDLRKNIPSTERLLKQPMPAMNRTTLDHNVHHEDEDHGEATLRGADFPQFPFTSAHKARPERSELQASQEDLFLNLAHADSPGEVGDEDLNEKRRRRVRECFIDPGISLLLVTWVSIDEHPIKAGCTGYSTSADFFFLHRPVRAFRALNLLSYIGHRPLNDRIAPVRLLPRRKGSTHRARGTSRRLTRQIRQDRIRIAYRESGPMPLRHNLSKTADTTPLKHLSILHEYAGALSRLYLQVRLSFQSAGTTSHNRLGRPHQHIDIRAPSIR